MFNFVRSLNWPRMSKRKQITMLGAECDRLSEKVRELFMSRNSLRHALREIRDMETPKANATVRRMSVKAHEALEKSYENGTMSDQGWRS